MCVVCRFVLICIEAVFIFIFICCVVFCFIVSVVLLVVVTNSFLESVFFCGLTLEFGH
jgi:hypothetical protein